MGIPSNFKKETEKSFEVSSSTLVETHEANKKVVNFNVMQNGPLPPVVSRIIGPINGLIKGIIGVITPISGVITLLLLTGKGPISCVYIKEVFNIYICTYIYNIDQGCP